MKRNRKDQSELQKVFMFLGVLFVLLVGSFFIGMYLGTDESGQSAGGTGPRVVTDHVLAGSSDEGPVGLRESAEPSYPVAAVGPRTRKKEEAPEALRNPSPPTRNTGKTASVRPVSPEKTAEGRSGRVYSVQVGAFRVKAQAEKLTEKLEKKGYSVYIISEKTGSKGVLYKVRVGRYSKKADADSLSKKIRKREGMQSFVAYR